MKSRGLDLRESARLLGYVHVATADTMIACWEAKYHYSFWRPNHAIQRADTDGNPAGAVTESLRSYFGTKHVQLVVTSTVTGTTLTYEELGDLVADVQDARVWGGLHYRSTVEQSSKYFPRIARDVGKHYFLSNHGDDEDDD